MSCTQTTPCPNTATTIYTSGASTALYNISGAIACSIATPAATVQISVNYTDPSGTVQTIAPAAAVCTTLGSGSVAAINQTVQIQNGTYVQYAVTTTSTPSYQARLAVLQLGVN